MTEEQSQQPPKQNVFDVWNANIRKGEASFVNFISAIAPWGAPLPAAYMSWEHMTRVLDFPAWLAWAVAIVIEILGFSTISTIISFWMHNRKHKDEKKQTPIWTALFSFAFYLFIVLTMNVVLDATADTVNARNAEIFVRGLLTLMTIPAAIILGVRTQHQEVLSDLDDSKETRMVKQYFKNAYGDEWEQHYVEHMTGKRLGSSGSVSNRTTEPTGKKKAAMDFIAGYYAANNKLPSLEEIQSAAEIVKSTASEFRRQWASKNLETKQ